MPTTPPRPPKARSELTVDPELRLISSSDSADDQTQRTRKSAFRARPLPKLKLSLPKVSFGGRGGGNGGKGGGRGNGGGRRSNWGRRLLVWGMTAAIWAGIALLGVVGYYAIDLPDIDQANMTTRRPSVMLKAADGETFAAFGDIYGEPLTLASMSPYIAQAVMATEDRRFYHHFGLDLIGLARAFVVNMRAGHTVQGGSTITQQLAKNLFLQPERTLKRKIQEALMAVWLEHRFTKDQILTIYLNRVYLGSGTWGVDAAARRYFEVSARDVNLYQAAMLAGLLKAPSRYSPINDPQAGHARTVDVLHNMVAAGMIDDKTADAAALAGAAQLVRRPLPAGQYYADWVMGIVNGMAEVQGKDIVVKTTMDMGLQRAAEAALDKLIETNGAKSNVSQGAVVVMDTQGGVRALVGGRDYDDSQFNRATQAYRQPGSSFKPFVYLTAMESGMTPSDIVEDAPVSLGGWSPGNYSGRFEGPVSLRHAFAESINTVAVRLIEKVGPNRVIATAHRMGISSELGHDASLALGTSEVTPLELTTAYVPFANGGQAVTAFAIEEIDDAKGDVLYRRQGGALGTIIEPDVLARMHDLMSAVISEGTGKGARLDRPAAGKTGTTQDYRDAWFMGFTADFVGGVWLGNDDQRHAMKKVTGGGLPAQLWKQVMLAAHRGLPARPLELPTPPEPANPFGGGAEGANGEPSSNGGIGGLIKGLFGQ